MKAIKDKDLINLIEELPEDLIDEVKDFIKFLLKKKKEEKKLKLKWKGGLSKYKDEFTSLELQKKSLEWREN